jgi:PTS system galactitol-specific IIA component
MSNKLLELLEPSAVCLNLYTPDATAVITTLGGLLMKSGYVKESFVGAALRREKELPTGLPLGGDVNAAIPHTDVEHVKRPGVAMATLQKPVVFQNMVSKEEAVQVRLVFLLALDQPKAQVEMLQEIAGVLQDDAVISKLIAAKNFSEVRQTLSSI